MAARVVHFGLNDCYRVDVLKTAGYSVDHCQSIERLHSNLIQFPDPDAVAIAEWEGMEPEVSLAVRIARATCAAPLILFRRQDGYVKTSDFDLVIPPLAPITAWLGDLETLINSSRAIRERSSTTRAQSQLLTQQAKALVEESRRERKRSESLLKLPPNPFEE
jgi:hypothetical protein